VIGGGSIVSGPKNEVSEQVVTGVLRESSRLSEACLPALVIADVSKQKLLTSASATCDSVSRPSIIITNVKSDLTSDVGNIFTRRRWIYHALGTLSEKTLRFTVVLALRTMFTRLG